MFDKRSLAIQHIQLQFVFQSVIVCRTESFHIFVYSDEIRFIIRNDTVYRAKQKTDQFFVFLLTSHIFALFPFKDAMSIDIFCEEKAINKF